MSHSYQDNLEEQQKTRGTPTVDTIKPTRGISAETWTSREL